MSLMKGFVCQVVGALFYNLTIDYVLEANRKANVMKDEVVTVALACVVSLFCFGVQLCTDSIEDQDGYDMSSAAKSNYYKTSADMEGSAAEFLNVRRTPIVVTTVRGEEVRQTIITREYTEDQGFRTTVSEVTVTRNKMADEACYAPEVEKSAPMQSDNVIIEEVNVAEPDRNICEVDEVTASEEEESESDHAQDPSEEELESEHAQEPCEEEEDIITVIDLAKNAPKEVEKTPIEVTENEEDEETKPDVSDNEEEGSDVPEEMKPDIPKRDIKKADVSDDAERESDVSEDEEPESSDKRR